VSVPVFEAVMAGLAQEGAVVVEADRVRLAGHEVKLNQQEQKEFDRLDAAFREAGLAAPSFEEALAGVEKRLAERVKVALLESGRLVDVGEGVALHREAIAESERKIREMFGRKPELTASEIRQELGTTRRYVIPLLNHFDTTGLTQRRGEKRVLRQKPVVPGN
jgi:selenocysteine-specific elongation factor